MSWQNILKTAIAGTERSSLPESVPAELGLRSSGDAARDALEALAAGSLLRKAGFQMTVAESSSGSRHDERPVCSAEAARDLGSILSGRYAEALPEFLDLLLRNQRRLPPEYLPDLLETAARNLEPAEKIMAAAGPVGEWLASQNPRWDALIQNPSADWFTASFAVRKRLLEETRSRNPLLALAWLEKTWPEENPEHKIRFLEILRNRLSATDENLLERAFSDKNREVRLAALQMLMLLPGSRLQKDLETLFEDRFAHALKSSDREKILKTSLPDLSEEALQPWFSLLSAKARANWREELLRLLIGLIPPARLSKYTGLSTEKMLVCLNDHEDAAALLTAIVLHSEQAWVEPVLQHFSSDFRHAIWQTKAMTFFLDRYIPDAMRFLGRKNLPISHENEFFLRAIEKFHQPWPESLMRDLLDQYGRTAAGGNGEIPGWHYASALRTAAYYGRPKDATGSEVLRSYLQNPQSARPREFDDFVAILRFRQEMQKHLA